MNYLTTLANYWPLAASAMMGAYGVFCALAPQKALASLTGKEIIFSEGEVEMTKRIAIVYGFGAVTGAMIALTGTSQQIQYLCVFSAVYNLLLCFLTQSKYWAPGGVKKNLPFVLVNLLVAWSLQN